MGFRGLLWLVVRFFFIHLSLAIAVLMACAMLYEGFVEPAWGDPPKWVERVVTPPAAGSHQHGR